VAAPGQNRNRAANAEGDEHQLRMMQALTTAVAVMIAMETNREKRTNTAHFNTDATTIGVDNRCTACISDNREQFVGELIPG
jgi:hypothetical protein